MIGLPTTSNAKSKGPSVYTFGGVFFEIGTTLVDQVVVFVIASLEVFCSSTLADGDIAFFFTLVACIPWLPDLRAFRLYSGLESELDFFSFYLIGFRLISNLFLLPKSSICFFYSVIIIYYIETGWFLDEFANAYLIGGDFFILL